MLWIQFQIHIPQDKITLFEELGGELIESLWWDESGEVNGVIPEDQKENFEERVRAFFQEEIIYSNVMNHNYLLDDQLKLEPVSIAGFFLYPPHYDGEIPEDRISFKIDSPSAFGSGHHETTQSCLAVMDELSKKWTPKKGLDIGCGSGILAMAMTALWDIPAFATDCDPESVAATKKNSLENGIDGVQVFECFGVDDDRIAGPFDLILANIHSEPLKELAPSVENLLSLDGKVLLSGLLIEQERDVVGTYEALGLSLEKRIHEGQWASLLFARKTK